MYFLFIVYWICFVVDDDYDDDDVCFELIPWIRLETFNGLPFSLTIYTSFPHLFPLSHLLPCVVSLSSILIFFLPIFHSLPFLDFVCVLMIWRFGILWCMGMVMFYFDVCVCVWRKFSESAHEFFLKFCMMVGIHKGWKVTEPDFSGKLSKSGRGSYNGQNGPKSRFFNIFEKLDH